jgi:DNA repair exonuclease SbcCD ATPase subunit
MNPTGIELENFGSYYGKHYFDLNAKGLTGIMGYNDDEACMDSNGSGKTTPFDALDWCCYGKVSRDGLLKSVYNDEALLDSGSTCWVCSWWVTDEGATVKITRGMRPKSSVFLHLEIDGVFLENLDIAETQVEIEKILGADREVFHASILFGQNDLVHYADAADAVRMRILTKILRLEEVDKMLDRAKESEKKLKNEIDALAKDRLHLDGKISGMEATDYSQAIFQWEEDRKRNIAQYQTSCNDLSVKIQVAQQQLNELPMCRASLETIKQNLNSVSTIVDRSALDAAREATTQSRVDHSNALNSLSSVKSRLDKFSSMGAVICTECEQQVLPGHTQGKVQSLSIEFNDLQNDLNQKETVMNQCLISENKIKEDVAKHELDLQNARQHWNVEMQKVLNKIQALEQQEITVDNWIRTLTQQQEAMQKLSNDVNPNKLHQERCNQEIQKLRSAKIILDQKIEVLECELQHVSFWVKGFSFQGLKSYILDFRLQELTDAANRWLKIITGGVFWIQFDSQKKQVSGKLANAPDLRVFKWARDGKIKETRYKKLSGGEKQRISFGVDFGLAGLSASRSSKKYDLLVLDEVFKHLDHSGKEAIMQVLPILAREKSSLFVIEHDPEIQAALDNTLYVLKQHDRSRLSTREEIEEIIRLKKVEALYGEEKKETEATKIRTLQAGANQNRTPRRAPIRSPITS